MSAQPLCRARARIAARCAALVAALTGCDVELPPNRYSEPQSHVYEYGDPIFFGLGGDSKRFKLSGWSHIEPEWTWTDGIGASLIIQIRPTAQQPLTLRMKLGGFVHPPELPYQPVDVMVNGRKIASWRVAEHRVYRAVIPPEVVGGGETTFSGHPADPRISALLFVDFYMPKAQPPVLLGDVHDWRRLGIVCSEFVIVEGAEPDAAEDDATVNAPDSVEGSPYTLGSVVRFGIGEDAARYKLSGWYSAERNFTWMGETAAVLGFKLQEQLSGRPLRLRATLGTNTVPPQLPSQPTLVYANGQQIAEWHVDRFADYTVIIPAELLGPDQPLSIEFRTPKATSPKALGVNEDSRKLGVALHELQITQSQ